MYLWPLSRTTMRILFCFNLGAAKSRVSLPKPLSAWTTLEKEIVTITKMRLRSLSRHDIFQQDARWSTDEFDTGLAIEALALIQYRQIADGCQGVWVLFGQQLFSKLQDPAQPHRNSGTGGRSDRNTQKKPAKDGLNHYQKQLRGC